MKKQRCQKHICGLCRNPVKLDQVTGLHPEYCPGCAAERARSDTRLLAMVRTGVRI